MSINITDELHAATTKGKIASAKEVFLTGDTENLQQIGEKTHQLEDSIKNIAATGGASTAAAVTFDNVASGMTAVNAQGAIEELNTKNKTQDTELSKKANITDVNDINKKIVNITNRFESYAGRTDKKISESFSESINNKLSSFAILSTEVTETYKDISKGLLYNSLAEGVLKAGTTIINLGVRIVFYKGKSSDILLDLKTGQQGVLTEDSKIVQSTNQLGKVLFIINAISTENIMDGAISAEKIAPSAVSIDKCDFSYIDNIIGTITENKYCYIIDTGEVVFYPNNSYDVTDYISVEENEDYALNVAYRYVHIFNSEKKLLRTLEGVSPKLKNFSTTDKEVYVIITLYKEKNKSYRLEKGLLLKNDTKNDILIKKEYLPNITKEDLPMEDLIKTEHVEFFLPKNIYVANGRTIEIYYEQICLNAHKFNIKAYCKVGKALDRKYQFIGSEKLIGKNYNLSVDILNDSQEVLAHGESVVHFVSSIITTEKKIVPFGDSLTNQKYWLTEVPILSNNKISFVGTRNENHEGRSGATIAEYLETTGKTIYSFDHNYTGAGSNSGFFSESQNYSIGDYCRYNNDKTTSTYVFITEHNAGPWDLSHVLNLTESNPFYDWKTKGWSISAYKVRNNLSYDAILLFLGTNGITLNPETNNNGALGLKTLIDRIRKEDNSTPIIVVNTIFRSSQNGIGSQGNTDGYSAQSEYKFNADKKVLLLAKALQEMIGTYNNVYISPCGFCMDSKYVFGMNKKPVNPRLTSVEEVYELYPKDSVHPQQAGYEQIADELFSTICAVFS